MLKHVGLHNAQKVTIVLRQMPSEEHMCLVLYDDKTPPRYFQAIKACLNSPEGQESKDFATALDAVSLDDGRQLARILYTEGHLKKVPTNQVFATPYGYESANKIKLNDLNEYLNKIDQGGEALEKMKQFDENKGMNKKTKSAQKLQEQSESFPTPQQVKDIVGAESLATAISEVKEGKLILDPKSASVDLRTQGENLRSVAAQLLQQAKLLADKAEQLYPTAGKRKVGRPIGSGLKVKKEKSSK
jgi:hypothetical protein